MLRLGSNKTRRFRSSWTMLTLQSAALRNSRSAELSLRRSNDFCGAGDGLHRSGKNPGVVPNRAIVGGLQGEVKDVRSLMALGGDRAGQRRRELRVNEEGLTAAAKRRG